MEGDVGTVVIVVGVTKRVDLWRRALNISGEVLEFSSAVEEARQDRYPVNLVSWLFLITEGIIGLAVTTSVRILFEVMIFNLDYRCSAAKYNPRRVSIILC